MLVTEMVHQKGLVTVLHSKTGRHWETTMASATQTVHPMVLSMVLHSNLAGTKATGMGLPITKEPPTEH